MGRWREHRAALGVGDRPVDPGRCRPAAAAAGRRQRRRQLPARQRHGGRRHPRPPRADRHPHGLVQGRQRRRAAGQVRHRPFLRASDVQGHQEPQGRRVRRQDRRDRRQRECLHLRRLHRLLPDGDAGSARHDDGLRGRPHAQPDPHRRGHRHRARRHPRGAPFAHRQQPRRAARRGDRRHALPEPALPHPGDRLDAGDREAEPHRCGRLLRPLLCAQQCGAGGRRRRRCRHGAPPGRGDLRQGAARTGSAAARAPAGTGAEHQAHRHPDRSARLGAELPEELGGALLRQRQDRRGRSARPALRDPRRRLPQPHLSGARRQAGHRLGGRRFYSRRRHSIHTAFADLRRAARRGPIERVEDAIDARSARSSRTGSPTQSWSRPRTASCAP